MGREKVCGGRRLFGRLQPAGRRRNVGRISQRHKWISYKKGTRVSLTRYGEVGTDRRRQRRRRDGYDLARLQGRYWYLVTRDRSAVGRLHGRSFGTGELWCAAF